MLRATRPRRDKLVRMLTPVSLPRLLFLGRAGTGDDGDVCPPAWVQLGDIHKREDLEPRAEPSLLTACSPYIPVEITQE